MTQDLGSDIKPWARPAPKGYKFINTNIVDVLSGTLKEDLTLVTSGEESPTLARNHQCPLRPKNWRSWIAKANT
ncbi:hypothetical protein N7541_011108 [Penicillium brevicompactum]|uniref:Uncharacterized protein n=1 Tax=Penicillium brevicompactum TaxID=5074 RepID=A0A9W9QSS2_PENBR|nr:hypothetical protein N7541_011108 [Penicillium brevicompactum]